MLLTGTRAIVYVQIPDADKPTYEGREIVIGPRAGDFYLVKSGLEEGDLVVTNGNFKLDSELQIRAGWSMMNPDPDAADPIPALVVSEEFRTKLGQAADYYLSMQERFAADEDVLWDVTFGNAPVFALDVAMLSGEARTVWGSQRVGLEEASNAFRSAPNFEARRALLSPLSELLIRALQTFGYTREGGDLRVFHCPMALDNTGANWIQVSETCANPYFGSSMLRCGKQTEVLTQGN